MATELFGAKMLAPFFGSSLYVWATVLAMTLGGLAAAVHAIFPFLFITTASRALEELNAMRDRNARRVASD